MWEKQLGDRDVMRKREEAHWSCYRFSSNVLPTEWAIGQGKHLALCRPPSLLMLTSSLPQRRASVCSIRSKTKTRRGKRARLEEGCGRRGLRSHGGQGGTRMKVDSGRALERVDVVARENRNGEAREGSRAKAAAVRNPLSGRSRRMRLSGTEIFRPSVSIREAAGPSRVSHGNRSMSASMTTTTETTKRETRLSFKTTARSRAINSAVITRVLIILRNGRGAHGWLRDA